MSIWRTSPGINASSTANRRAASKPRGFRLDSAQLGTAGPDQNRDSHGAGALVSRCGPSLPRHGLNLVPYPPPPAKDVATRPPLALQSANPVPSAGLAIEAYLCRLSDDRPVRGGAVRPSGLCCGGYAPRRAPDDKPRDWVAWPQAVVGGAATREACLDPGSQNVDPLTLWQRQPPSAVNGESLQ